MVGAHAVWVRAHPSVCVYVNQKLVPWAGLGNENDRARLRGFGMLDSVALTNSPVRLHAPEKSGKGALEDERANWTASSQLEGDMSRLAQQPGRSIAKQLSGQVPADRLGALIACQPNLHNGALHLGAHLDWPLHEGFGICIATVAIKGGGNVLLLGGEGDEDEDGNQPPCTHCRTTSSFRQFATCTSSSGASPFALLR